MVVFSGFSCPPSKATMLPVFIILYTWFTYSIFKPSFVTASHVARKIKSSSQVKMLSLSFGLKLLGRLSVLSNPYLFSASWMLWNHLILILLALFYIQFIYFHFIIMGQRGVGNHTQQDSGLAVLSLRPHVSSNMRSLWCSQKPPGPNPNSHITFSCGASGE